MGLKETAAIPYWKSPANFRGKLETKNGRLREEAAVFENVLCYFTWRALALRRRALSEMKPVASSWL
jgi:hypothetical protein